MSRPDPVSIRVAREVAASGIKQIALARRLGMGERTLRRRLLGETYWTAGEVVTLAGILGVRPADLLGEVEA